jgi:nitrite reductase/ring-hydroxylating ferredoxin subunit
MAEIYIGREEDFTDRDRKVISHGDLEIGVFMVDGDFYAYENRCVHQGGPICQGRILNRVVERLADDKTSDGLAWSEDDVHIVCPWHGYEFNLKTGIHPGNKNARLRPFDVSLRNGEIYVTV